MTINYLEKITQVWAFVSVDEGGEGIIAMTVEINGQDTFMPFVCADKERMESLRPRAKEIARATGKKVKLIRLTQREEVEEI